MGRAPRLQVTNVVYHVNTVGAGGIDIFRDHDDRSRFLRILAYVTEKYAWRCHLYCLLSNHYHLVVTTVEPNIASVMHVLNGVYAQTFNKRHGRKGHLFGARYHDEIVRTEAHALAVCSYVPLNPWRAGLCDLPEHWPWSSYAATIGLRKGPWFLDDEWVLRQFDEFDIERARMRYRNYVTSAMVAELTTSLQPSRTLEVPGTLEVGEPRPRPRARRGPARGGHREPAPPGGG